MIPPPRIPQLWLEAAAQAAGEKQASIHTPLAGTLYLAESGQLRLAVPLAVARGYFQALQEPGLEFPGPRHVEVMTAREVEAIGPDRLTERGHVVNYQLGRLRDDTGPEPFVKVWAVPLIAPALQQLRRSYGLTGLPADGRPFQLVVAVRRRGVVATNSPAHKADD